MYKIVKLKQGSQDWLDWRLEHITASEIGCIACVDGSFSSIYEIWLRKRGFLEEVPDNPALTRGRNYEDLLRRAVEEISGLALRPECVESTCEPWIAASLDALSTGDTDFWEFKIPGEHTHLMVKHMSQDGLLKYAEQYYAQTQWQHLCLGNTKKGHFASALGGEETIPFHTVWPYDTFKSKVDLVSLDIEINPPYQVRLQEAGWEFFKLLKRNTLPEKELEKIARNFKASGPIPVLEDDPEELSRRMDHLLATKKRLEDRAEEIRNSLINYVATLNKDQMEIGEYTIEKTTSKRSLKQDLVKHKLEEVRALMERRDIKDVKIDLDIEKLKVPSRPGWKVSKIKERDL